MCNEVNPPLRPVGTTEHRSACHFAETLAGIGFDDLRERVDEAALEEEADTELAEGAS